MKTVICIDRNNNKHEVLTKRCRQHRDHHPIFGSDSHVLIYLGKHAITY